MKQIGLLWLLILAVSCDVVRPTTITAPVDDVTPDALVNASIVILTQEGYTIATAEATSGLITTEWREESSFASQHLLGISRRKRVSIIYDLLTGQVTVQMTKQKMEDNHAWRTDGLSGNDRDELDRILGRVQERAQLIRASESASV
jgi:hypothetical protein